MRLVQVVGGPILVATALGFGWIAWRLRESSDRPGGTGLVGIAAVLCAVSTAEAVVYLVGWPVALFHPLTQIAVFAGAICWAAFAVAYTGRGTGGRTVFALVVLMPTVGLVTALLRMSPFVALVAPIETASAWYLIGSSLAMIASFGVLIGMSMLLVWDGTRYTSFERRRGLSLATVGVTLAFVPVSTSLLEVADVIPVLTGAIVAQTTALAALAVAVGVGRPYRSLPIAEAIGRDAIVSNLRDAVVVVDQDALVVDMNDSAE